METLNNPTTETNAIVYLMKNYAAYNLWANTTLINWLSEKPSNLMQVETPSSFCTIQKTILHIWQTQVYWLSVLKQEIVVEPIDFNGDVAESFQTLITQSAELHHYVVNLTEQQMQQNTQIVNPWFLCSFPNFEYLMQVINHGTYHRGQVITMAHHLGLKGAPMTDYNYYNIHGKEVSPLQFTQQLISSLTMGTMALPVL